MEHGPVQNANPMDGLETLIKLHSNVILRVGGVGDL